MHEVASKAWEMCSCAGGMGEQGPSWWRLISCPSPASALSASSLPPPPLSDLSLKAVTTRDLSLEIKPVIHPVQFPASWVWLSHNTWAGGRMLSSPKASQQYCMVFVGPKHSGWPQTRACPKAADLMKQVARWGHRPNSRHVLPTLAWRVSLHLSVRFIDTSESHF